ncbi:MAG: hypothetical protein HY078_00225 [Elusimicrobia bacterium]|nr:hypothetical protein [Elusimicrobiota bacterium]
MRRTMIAAAAAALSASAAFAVGPESQWQGSTALFEEAQNGLWQKCTGRWTGERHCPVSFTPDVPEARPSAVRIAAAGVLIEPTLWNELKPASQSGKEWLARRLGSDFNMNSDVRVLTIDKATAILDKAAMQGATALDVFSDPEMNKPNLYYIPESVLKQLDARYKIPAITLISGTSLSGTRFQAQALLLGNRRVEALYDAGADFVFKNSYYPAYDFTSSPRVTHVVRGRGDLSVSGLWVRAGSPPASAFGSVTIRGLTKRGQNQVFVQTSTALADTVEALEPISFR